jgi:RNA polymerase sigma factor (sigma-70 family)
MRSEADVLLWRSFKTGDWDAYARLYDSYFGLLNNYGYRFTKETELIEDAVHDLFVRLWTSRERLSVPASVKNYLFKSLRNILLRKMKTEEKYTDIDGQEYPVSFSFAYDNEALKRIEDIELQARVKTFVQALPTRQQEIIYLRFYEGLSYDEIADVMSISVNSAYKLLYKALERLQAILGAPSSLTILLCLKFFSTPKG